MPSTDKIEFPISLRPNEAELAKFIQQTRAQLEAGLTDVNIKLFGQKFTQTTTSQIELEGKKFEVRSRARPRIPEEGEDVSSYADLLEVSTTVKEIQEGTHKALSEEAKKLKQFKERIRHFPLRTKEVLLTEYIRDFGDIGNELTAKLESVQGQIARQQMQRLKKKLAGRDPGAQMSIVRKAIRDQEILVEDGETILRSLKERFGNIMQDKRAKRFKIERTRIGAFSPETQIQAFEQLLQTGTFLDNTQRLQIEKRIQELKQKVARGKFRQQSTQLGGLGLEEQIKGWENYINIGGELREEAERKIRELSKRRQKQLDTAQKMADSQFKAFARERFGQTSTSLSGEDLHDQIRGWREYIQAGGEFEEEARSKMRTLSERLKKQVQSARRTKFSEFRKRVEGIDDPVQQIAELDNYINNAGARFSNEARAMRRRVQRGMQNERAARERERNRGFANMSLVGSGIGLGLLGAAGFPLLNVGFSAMSGGPVGAGLVGAATAMGELSRAINRLSESSVAAAKEIGFVSKSFKLVEARSKAFSAFAGAGALAAEEVAMQRREEYWRNSGRSLLNFNRFFTSAKRGPMAELEKEFTSFRLGGATLLPFRMISETLSQFRQGSSRQLDILESSRTSFLREMMRGGPGVENDPYQSWLRIQNSALDVSKQNETEIRREMIKKLDEEIAALKENTEALKGNKTPASTVTGMF